jgi:hypothetical protein
VLVESLKVLDPEWPIREADIDGYRRDVGKVPTGDIPHADRLNKSRPWAALNSILSIGDQAVIKAGFGFRRWAALADNF